MYFAKNEVITLNNNKKYLIIDSAVLDDIVYYKIKEVVDNHLIGDEKYICPINREGKIYINDKISNEVIDRIKELFES